MNDIHRKMHALKKRFVRISNYEICELKRLMREFDVQYIDSDGESDLLCAHLVKSGVAQVCMSDDMDLFLYGCPVVLRHVNIWYGTGVEYTLDTILTDLKISFRGFRMVCVLSGTDYTFSDSDAGKREETDDESEPDNCSIGCGVRRRLFRIYLSDLVKYYFTYSNDSRRINDGGGDAGDTGDDGDNYNRETGFDDGFYEWVIATHFRGLGTTKCLSEKELKIAMAMFQRAYAIFSSGPSDAQMLCVDRVQTAISVLKHSETRGCGYNIPHKVKRIMAKYNFIYI